MTRVSWFPLSLARLGLAAALLAFSAGCVSSRAFVPGEHLTGFSPDGAQPAAEYALLEDGEALGDVKVWSSGAVRDGSRTQVHVAFEITNQSRAPLRFDARQLFLEELPEKGKPPGREPAQQVEGQTFVPAGQSRELSATFALPDGIWPSDVPGYRVGWVVVAGKAHARKTPFVYVRGPRELDPWPSYGPYYGYYYPGFYGSWATGYRWPPPWRGPRYYYSPYYYPAYRR